jgi:Flp pilus assembly protein TadD/predicted  nucleic acid-binding Zn-ribbon protein
MKRIVPILLAGFSLFMAPVRLSAQSDDPSEVFLKAYMTSQQGEKLEHENQFKAALAKFRFAGSLLEELRKSHTDWQPAIVEYRSRKIGESILRVQNKLSTQQDLTATTESPAPSSAAPVLPQNAGPPEPNVDLMAPPAVPSRAEAANDSAIQETTKRLHEKVDDLQAELEKSRNQYSAVQKEKEALNGRLQQTNAKLEKAQADLEKTKTAEKEVRSQLSQAQQSLTKIEGAGGEKDAKAQAALRAEIAQLKKALATAEQGRAEAEKEKSAASTKLSEANTQIAGISKERDAALAQLKNAKVTQERVQTLLTENTQLKQKLADAEKTVREIGQNKPEKEREVAAVKQQVADLQQQLAASQKQNREYETTIAGLRSQLDEVSQQLNTAKLTGANADETARLTKENEMLRAIVVREREEEARRDQAKKLMVAEFDKLKIKSDTLNKQVELLAQPVTKLSNEELALLRHPVVVISDNNPSTLKASFTAPKQTSDAKIDNHSAETSPAAQKTEAPPSGAADGPAVQTDFKPGVPPELVPVAREAKDNFDRGKYHAAEKQYQEILAKSPNNLYSLSNLGVVYFRTGKWKAAEVTLKKAITLSPKDEFSHTTLGIVYYRQSKFDDALNELTKALGINPKSAAAHNYLGITASQKGWQEAAEKEMLEALNVNPDYADAHFNLAVLYATSQPPSKDLAKQHYAKATQLGAEHDSTLEKLLQ